MKITALDYSILGLLATSSFTGYQIRMVFEKTAMGKFSGSPGTIYPALARLEKQGLIGKKEVSEKRTELFAITKAGLRALNAWILSPPTREDITRGIDTLSLRIAFLDLTDDTKKRSSFLSSFSEALQQYIGELESYYKTTGTHMPKGGKLAYEHGIHSYKSTLKWIQKVQSAYSGKA
ncbi:PadR family transcriptional regulator [Chryseolinea sp. T2]|uniref:PadR family transcriptional regulator n=1 Tax=Chryseolinea sp. T2 TaxID=3129255 RepID=UPI0030789466